MRDLKFKLSDTTLTSDVNQTLSNLLAQTNKVKEKVIIVSGVANRALSTAVNPSLALENLTDVLIAAIQNGQTITWNGTAWVNSAVGLSLNTAGQGFLWTSGTGLYGSGPITETYSTFTAVANTVLCYQFIVPFQITVRKVTIAVSGTSAASTINGGIYSFDGNTKLVDINVSSASAGIKTATLSTPVVLSPGVYWFAFSNTGQPNVTFGPTFQVGGTNLISAMNASVVRVGAASTSTASGVMPATLGTITSHSGNLPVFLLEV